MSADGTGVVTHAGNVATRLLADQVGLTGALSSAMARLGFTPSHDRGQVLADVAVLIAGGGESIADIDVLRHQSQVLGSVVSAPTVWRALDEITPAASKKVAMARAKVRAYVWSQLPGGLPASKVAGTDLGEVVVLDVDATLVTTHSEKEGAASGLRGDHPRRGRRTGQRLLASSDTGTVVSAITAMRESVRVNCWTALHSRAQLRQDIDDILADEQRRAVPDEYRAHGLMLRGDGACIVVEVEKISPDEERRRAHRHVIATEITLRSQFCE